MNNSKSSSRSLRLNKYHQQCEETEKKKQRKEKQRKKREYAKTMDAVVVVASSGQTDEQPQTVDIKRRKKEVKQQQEVANKLWKHFDRQSETKDANPYFSSYYQDQLGLESEWKSFINSLSQGLPVTFRLNRGRFPVIVRGIEHRLNNQFKFSGSFVRVGMDKIIPSSDVVKGVNWVKDVYQLGVDRNGFVKAKALGPLYETISREARLGHLARQGIASMLPAIVLSPKPSDIVLDMCAAPGSKSEQLLQLIGSQGDGMVMTNDSDPKRLEMVKRRFQKIGRRNVVISCSRGEDLYKHIGSHYFDGIVCDVPCTGDGTIRKYPYLWRRWRACKGILLHPLQLQLAQSAASLLKVGGRMVYSTCSLNPIEDEAVVAALLNSARGALKLVKIELTGFKLREGISKWDASEELMNRGAMEDELDDVSEAKKKKSHSNTAVVMTASMSAPSNSDSLDLKYCGRILHHDNNTEGFFIALIEKVSPWEMNKLKTVSAKKAKKVLKDSGFNPALGKDRRLEIVAPVDMNDLIKSKIKSQFDIPEEYFSNEELMLRDIGNNKLSLILTSKTVTSLLHSSWATPGKIPILHAGVDLATVLAVINPKTQEMEDISNFMPVSAGAMDLVSILSHDLSNKWIAPTCRPEFMSLLQLCMEVHNEENDEEISEEIKSKEPAEINIPLQYCYSVLEEEEEEDLKKELSIRLEALPVGHSLAIVLKTSELTFEDVVDPDPEVSTGKRISVAERRKLKKLKKSGVEKPDAESQDIKCKETNKLDMFRDVKDDTSVSMVLLFYKSSPATLKLLTDFDYVISYGQTLQTLFSN